LPLKGGETLEEFFTSTVQTTFSIAVAAYLLVRMETRMSELTKAINELQAGLRKCIECDFYKTERK